MKTAMSLLKSALFPFPRPPLRIQGTATSSATCGVPAIDSWIVPAEAAAAKVSLRLLVSSSPFSFFFLLLPTGGSLITGSAHKRFVPGRFVSAAHPLTPSHGEIRVTHTRIRERTHTSRVPSSTRRLSSAGNLASIFLFFAASL